MSAYRCPLCHEPHKPKCQATGTHLNTTEETTAP